MVYHVIGTMSGSSIDGLDIAYCTLEEIGGKWSYTINQASCIPFDTQWKKTLSEVLDLSAKELLLAHAAFGQWMGEAIVQFIDEHHLHHKVHLIASHGHTVFHEPNQKMTFQMGDGSAIAAKTKLPVVTDLRNMDIALGGQGAPIVPIGEKMFWDDYSYFLNIGGISNITFRNNDKYIAYDVCPANRVLNLLSNELELNYDHQGEQARKGKLIPELYQSLNALDYYQKPYPKSLANHFGTDVIYPLIQGVNATTQDKLYTYCEHIAFQIARAVNQHFIAGSKMLITGGGALNTFLIEKINEKLSSQHLQIEVPDETLVQYKEALVMALIGALRWREEINVLSSVTGAERNSVGGALWMGQE